MTAVFDGSFEGFLTLIHESYYQKFTADHITTQIPASLYRDSIKDITADIQKADKVYAAMKKKFSKRGFKRVLHCFLSKEEAFYLPLYEYVLFGFKDDSLLENINLSSIKRVHEIEKKVFRALHKAYGFTRFVELKDGTLYAKVKLEFHLLPLLAKHFIKRLGVYDFMIHDVEAEMLVYYKDKKLELLNVASFDAPPLSDAEQKFSSLWQLFFQSVSIESRENKKLQQNMLPLVYREYMTEFN